MSRWRLLLLTIGVLGAVALFARPQLGSTDEGVVGGGPQYDFNEPFLDWPQTGDLACETEDGPCGTAYPTLSSDRQALGRSLSIPVLAVPVGDVGKHELVIGDLVFMDGIHTRTFFRIANADIRQFRVVQPHVEFRPREPGRPPFSEFARERPVGNGPEPVTAVLVWTTDWAAPGATMDIRDLIVE